MRVVNPVSEKFRHVYVYVQAEDLASYFFEDEEVSCLKCKVRGKLYSRNRSAVRPRRNWELSSTEALFFYAQ